MTSGALSIFVNSINTIPLALPINGKYMVLNPRDIKIGKVSKTFAIFREEGVPIQIEVDAATNIGAATGIVLDSTLSTEFLLIEEHETTPFKTGVDNSGKKSEGQETVYTSEHERGKSKNAEIYILDSSSSNDEINESSKRQTSSEKENNVEKNMNFSSAIELILTHPNRYSSLHRLITRSSAITKVQEIPISYDGDVVFELPPSRLGHSNMEGMEQRYDGHCWIKPVLSRMTFPATIRRSKCGGHFQCNNDGCSFMVAQGNRNEKSWLGKLTSVVPCAGLMSTDYGSLKCFYCHSSVVLLRRCEAHALYILSDGNLSRLCIHRGFHAHPVMEGVKRSTILLTRGLVQKFVNSVPQAAARQVQMNLAKEIVLRAFVTEKNIDEISNNDIFEPAQLHALLEELEPLVATNKLRHMVKEARCSGSTGVGLESKLLQLKKGCIYPFFQSMMFPNQSAQQRQCSHVFKMSTSGPGSGVDIVERMRRSGKGDLRHSWVCFDHVKRVTDGWTTMACHVYDPMIQEMQTIAICDMRQEDTEAQQFFWEQLNDVMLKSGHQPADFHGFMADEAQANWNAVRIVYNDGNPMSSRERSCLFHWVDSMNLHTKKYVAQGFQDAHKELCNQWRNAETEEIASKIFRQIRAFWASGKVADSNIPYLECWLSWWHIRYPHWRKYFSRVSS